MKKLFLLAIMAIAFTSCATTYRSYSNCPSHDKYFFQHVNRGPSFGR